MRMPVSPYRRVLTVLAGVLIGLFALFAIPAGAADAHAALVRTDPVPGSIVPSAPSEIVITFSEAVQPVVQRIQVIDPDGKRIDTGTPRVIGDQLHIPVRTDGPRGTYLVSYRVISADTHPVGGGFIYSVGAPSPGGAPIPINGGTTDRVVATGVSVDQFLGFAGLILVVGPALVLIALWPRRLDRRGPTKLAYTGLGTVAAASILGIYLQAPYGDGGTLFSVTGTDISDVLDSRYGQAHLVRLAIVVVSAFLLRPVLAGRGGRVDQALLAVLAVIGIGTWPIAGHPGASDVASLTTIADMAHLASVAIWLGGLVMLAAYLLRRANARELTAILPVWSNWATLAVTVLILAGTAQALIEIGSFGALLHTTYGQLVLVKIGILAVILAVANTARKLVQQHAVVPVAATATVPVGVPAGGPGRSGTISVEASGEPDSETFEDDPPSALVPDGFGEPQVRRLRRSVLIELALAALVLVASSILVQSTPARTAAAEASQTANSPLSVTLNSPIYSLQVDFSPIPTGVEIHMYAYTPQGAPLKVVQWTVTAALPARDIEPTTVGGVLAITDSHATAQATLPVKGDWMFAFTLRTSAIDEATVYTTVPIS